MVSRTTSAAKVALLCAAAAVLILAGCGGHGTHEVGAEASPTASAAVSATHTEDDAMFAAMMIPHHEQAVEMADLVPTRSENAEVVALAAEIKGAQGPEITRMQGWLDEGGVDAGSLGDHSDHGGMAGMQSPDAMRDLAALQGEAFDTAWLTMMIDHHRGAVEMAQDVLDQPGDAQVAALAREIISAQEREIAQMTAMLQP